MPDSPQTTAALAGPSSVSPLSSGAFSPDSPPLASSSSMLPARDGGSGYSPLTDPSDFVGRSKSKKGKGKMREVIAPSSTNNDGWLDLERQDVGGLTSEDDQEMIRDGWERVNELSPTPGATAYPPPLTEEEQEAKRIADNLALWKERDLARRRAARESKQARTSSGASIASSFGSLTGVLRGGGGSGGGGSNSHRWSLWSASGSQDHASNTIPFHAAPHSPPPTSSPPAGSSHPTTVAPPSAAGSSSMEATTAPPPPRSPMSPTSATSQEFEYRGPKWRGGAAAVAAAEARQQRRREKSFWENLCGTGRDRVPGESRADGDSSDDDDGDQAGKTNPFE